MTRAPARPHLDRHGVERVDRAADRTAAAVVVRMRSRGPPSASSTVSRDAPKPGSASRRASAAGPSPSEVKRQDARARLQMRTDEIERAAVQRDERGLRQRPAEPRGRQAEGGGRRHHHDLLRPIWRASTAPTP